MTTETTTVALLGTGTMGAGMARNIAAAGLPLRVWNRTPERAEPLAETSARVCRTVAEAVEGADVVVTMLWDAGSVETALREGGPALAAGTVLLQTTTVGVAGADRLQQVAEELGLVHVDAPVLGTKAPAQAGTLVVLASGPDDARDRVAGVLDAVGSRTLWLGAAGAGSRLKLAANAYVISLTASVAQSLAPTEALGIDPARFLEAVAGGPLDSPYLRTKGAVMMSGDFTPSFGIEGGAKDAGLILEAAAGQGLELPVLAAVREQIERVVAAGHGGEDLAAVHRDYRPR
jgi:3-hydroxyisobutyrate dehydrogenase